MRLQKNVQFKEYQRLHSEKKRLKEKPGTYRPNTCVLMGDSILNGLIGIYQMIDQLKLENSPELLSTT